MDTHCVFIGSDARNAVTCQAKTVESKHYTLRYAPLKRQPGHGRYSAYVTLLDGSRKLARCHRYHREDQRPLAEQWAAEAARQLRGSGGVKIKGETCDEWYERFAKHRKDEVGSVDDDRWRWSKWISPHIGTKAIVDVTPDDIETIKDALTAAVIAYEAAGSVKGEGRLAPKTSRNVWAALTTAMKYASTRKGPRELRVREKQGNPCLGIPPPRNGDSKQRHWCRPGEILAVLACEAIAIEWREAIAIGCYLHLRPGELHELRVMDLDLAAGEVAIRRAFDEREKVVTTPKTSEGIRHVTVPPALMPLLRRIERERQPTDRVAPIVAATPEKSRAGIFRDHLRAAKVTRAELYVETPTHLQIDFRSLRDSGITWRFLAGHRAEIVQREAGHEHITTTLGYAKEVANRGGRFGVPFPSLPPSLTDPSGTLGPSPGSGDKNPHNSSRLGVGEAGFENGNHIQIIGESNDIGPSQERLTDARDPVDPIESALAGALTAAAAAGRFDVVAQLAREIESRRLERAPNVVALDRARRR